MHVIKWCWIHIVQNTVNFMATTHQMYDSSVLVKPVTSFIESFLSVQKTADNIGNNT